MKTYSLQDREQGGIAPASAKKFDYLSPDGEPMILYRYCEICSFRGAFEPGSLRTEHRTRGFRTEAAAMRTCPNCGSRVYSLGCVNCDEENYSAEQVALDGPDPRECPTCRGSGGFYHRWTEPGPPIPSDCDGAGWPTEIEREEYAACPDCDGTGRRNRHAG